MKYRYRDDKKKTVSATRVPTDMTTAAGLELQAGEWLVVEDDEESAWPHEEFEEAFEEAPNRSLVRRNPAKVARRKKRRSSGDGNLVAIGDMESAVKHLFRDGHQVQGYELVDEETGLVVQRVEPKQIAFRYPEGSPVRQDLEPSVEDVEIGPDGQVKRMRVKPVEWPPKHEKF